MTRGGLVFAGFDLVGVPGFEPRGILQIPLENPPVCPHVCPLKREAEADERVRCMRVLGNPTSDGFLMPTTLLLTTKDYVENSDPNHKAQSCSPNVGQECSRDPGLVSFSSSRRQDATADLKTGSTSPVGPP